MAKARERNRRLADGWLGFRGRLAFAIDQRKVDSPGLTQNAIADAAGIDSGQLTKILSGERARGVAANTVLLLADALKVRPIWLMVGEEPSGLGRVTQQIQDEQAPESSASPTSAPPSRASGSGR